MQGSYSIKKVLPAMVPEMSYAGMEVADGQAAMQAYQRMCEVEDVGKLRALREAMLKYCEMDTLAEVWILEELDKFK